jgi:hypothetical protein
MLAYSILDKEEMGSLEGVDDEKKPHMTAYLIEKIIKQYKSHLSASDFDAGFINKIVDKMQEQQYTNNSKSENQPLLLLLLTIVIICYY